MIQIIIGLASALIIQFILNIVSKKINYEYSKQHEILAIVLNVFVWGIMGWKYGYSTNVVIMCIVISFLISIMFIDFKYYEIPNEYNLALLIIGAIFLLLNLHNWSSVLFGGVIGFGLFFLLMVITRGSIGGGDVKLAGNLGLFLGMFLVWKFISFSFIFGAIVSFILLVLKKKKKNDKIAFGPYMVMAFIAVFLL